MEEKAKKATRRLGRKRSDNELTTTEFPSIPSSNRRSKGRETILEEDPEDSSKQSHSTKSSFDNIDSRVTGKVPPRLRKINEAATIVHNADPPLAFEGFDDNEAFAAASSTFFPTTNSNDIFEQGGAFAANVAFDSAFDNTNIDFGTDMGFGSPMETTQKDAIVYETSPWTNLPKGAIPSSPPKWALPQRTVLTQDFLAPPVVHPTNGAVLFIASSPQHGVRLHQVDPQHHFMSRAAVPILSSDLRRMVSSKYNATVYSVYKVWTLTVSVLQESRCTRVAAICDFRILEATTTLRLVLLWQDDSASWTLQQVTTPPAGGDFACDLSTLQISSTGLLLVAGASPKGACIFISQLKEAWSANFLGTTGGGSVVAMAVSLKEPYLAVALADQTVSIWTFQAATTNTSSSKRWLFPLCQLNFREALAAEPLLVVSNEKDGGSAAARSEPVEPGLCSHLVWLPASSTFPSLVLLAVALEGGLALFHVDLPIALRPGGVGFDRLPEPTPSTVITATPVLVPILACPWQGAYESSHLAFVQYGPLMDFGMVILLQDAQLARIVWCTLQLPMYQAQDQKEVISLRVLANTIVAKDDAQFPNGVLPCFNRAGSVLLHSKQSLSSMALTKAGSTMPASFYALPVTSIPLGLSSMGDPFSADTPSDLDGVLYIVSSIQCERTSSVEGDASLRHWSHPTRRFWLCRAVAGDTMETVAKEEKEESDFGDSYQVFGGATARVLCALKQESGRIPLRIVRCSGPKAVCAVVWGSAFSSNIADSVTLVEFSKDIPIQEVLPGRDVTFFPTDVPDITQGLILSMDGASLTYFDWNSITGFHRATSFRPLLGINDGADFIDCQRIHSFSDGSKLNLAVSGRRYRDHRACFITGDVGNVPDATAVEWSRLLPNFVSGRTFWFMESEEVLTVVGLQGDGSGYRNFAVSTSARVLILSSALSVSAEAVQHVTNGLAPLGSFAVCFASSSKIRYLSCLDQPLSSGTIASISESSYARTRNDLMCIRPDRLILNEFRTHVVLIEQNQSDDLLKLSVPSTMPALVLEPMIANAVCVGGKQSRSNRILYHVIEKFGRKISSIVHGEREGIGTYGAGLTSRAFSILREYRQVDAASWMLTGTANFDKTANTRLLPPWLPIGPKSNGALNAEAFLHLLSSGDSYLTEYIKDPNRNSASTLPRPTDTIALLCREYAEQSLNLGRPLDSIKMLDLSGADSTENVSLLLSLSLMKRNSDLSTDVLNSISGFASNGNWKYSNSGKATAALSALATLSNRNAGHSKSAATETVNEQLKSLVKPLAPSLLHSKVSTRTRQALMGGRVFEVSQSKRQSDPLWNTPCNESKHVWNEGPKRERENLLLLDSIEDWLGRKRPVIFGKEGAFAVKDRGETTLADILNQDDDTFGDKNNVGSVKDSGWIEGIGEGRSDDANLCAYFRMSEGEDDDSSWRADGFLDLSPYQNKAFIVGDPASFSLQNSTSGVDEGEAGKVKSLFDLVFESPGKNLSSGLALPASRGGSLDIGVLQLPDREARKKASVEFWFYLPQATQVAGEIVLIRRTWGLKADNFMDVAVASKREHVLWELVLHQSGEYEFRTAGGSSILSRNGKGSIDVKTTGGANDQQKVESSTPFERWNHVCLVLSSKGMNLAECFVTLYLKGIKVVSGKTFMFPPKSNVDEWNNNEKLSEAMKKSHLLFGLNHCVGFRLTELRIWACERSAEDTQSFLYEYLTAAEQKKKFKVKIANKNKIGPVLGKGSALNPPKKGLPVSSDRGSQVGLSLAPPDRESTTFSLKPPKPSVTLLPESLDVSKRSTPNETQILDSNLGKDEFGMDVKEPVKLDPSERLTAEGDPSEPEVDVAVTLWDSAVPLSQQLRPSAAAALIRGPPATRHYGGNRGGLPDFSGDDRFGVGGIAICGSEKTIVFRDNEDPPAVTYPIGASGAVVSDQMDDDGSEFLCCFLAKEGRMVVFELRSRTVVVELQMTTKLNFWRYLPPEAADNSLCYMLVTPVGGFHWKPLEESPRPHQVWKRGSELQGKKVVNYEEGGSNGGEGDDICSRVGLITVTQSSAGGSLEGWLLPISGDSQALQIPFDLLGACLCQPLNIEQGEEFLPLLVTVSFQGGLLSVNVISIVASKTGSLALGEVVANQVVEDYEMNNVDFEPPALAMGPFPEAICVSLSNIIVVVMRRKGFVAAFEFEGDELNIIAIESVDHFVIDAVMRYSPDVGGAEIVMLLSDVRNPKDGRIVSFCFRSAV